MEAGRVVQHCVSINTAAQRLMRALEHCRDEEASHQFLVLRNLFKTSTLYYLLILWSVRAYSWYTIPS